MNILQPIERLLENFAVEKQQGTESLVLSGRCHFPRHGQMSQILADLAVSHLPGMAFLVKQDVVLDPAQVSLFSLDAVVFDTNQVANLLEQFRHRR